MVLETRIKNNLIQRCKEIDPDWGGNLHTLLMCPLIPSAADVDSDDDNTVYIIFKTSADGSLTCLPEPAAKAMRSDIDFSKDADGSDKELVDEFPLIVVGYGGIPFGGVPVGVGTPVEAPDIMTIEGTLNWKPGSGYDGNLGEVKLERGTRLDINGIVVFP